MFGSTDFEARSVKYFHMEPIHELGVFDCVESAASSNYIRIEMFLEYIFVISDAIKANFFFFLVVLPENIGYLPSFSALYAKTIHTPSNFEIIVHGFVVVQTIKQKLTEFLQNFQ